MKMNILDMIEDAKKTEHGAIWYSSRGPIHFTNKGEIHALDWKMPLYDEIETVINVCTPPKEWLIKVREKEE